MPEVSRATAHDVQAAGRVLALAFSTDPHVTGLLPTTDDAIAGGAWVDVARADGRVVGAAVWEPPGHRGSRLRALAGIPTLLRTYGRRTPDAVRTHAAAARARPDRPHWYLEALGADPAAQGTGVGSGLVRAGLARAAGDGVGTYLESSTPDNLPFYRRLGFSELAAVRTYGTTDLHAMWQDPDTTRSS